jgi:major membrane immunogen (membrane-anchored lipoprotein)
MNKKFVKKTKISLLLCLTLLLTACGDHDDHPMPVYGQGQGFGSEVMRDYQDV